MKKILMICLATCTFRQKSTMVLIDHKNKLHSLQLNTLQGNMYVAESSRGSLIM